MSDAAKQLRYAVGRESQAIQSVTRLVPEQRRSAVKPTLDSAVARLRAFGVQQELRVIEAGQVRTPQTVQPPHDEAEHIVVKRKRFGTIPLDDLPHAQWEGYPSGAWAAVPTLALYWCDGRRTLADVIQLTRMELGATEFDFVGYFKFLERRGYVEFGQ